MTPRIAAIVLNYKHLDDTITCINKLTSSDKKTQIDYIVIDNSPIPSTPKKLLEIFPKIKYIPTKSNLGFAKGINLGLRYALGNGYDYFLVINPDVSVTKNFPSLLANFKDNKVGIVAPAIRHTQNNHTMYGLDGYVDWKYAKPTHFDTPKPPKPKKISAQFVTFACVLISKDLLLDIGFLDERYFMYCEDVDFCLTTKESGFKIILDTTVLVDHNTSSSFSIPTQKLPISFKSQLKFISKWLPWNKQIIPYLFHSLLYPYLYLLWSYHYYKNRGKNK